VDYFFALSMGFVGRRFWSELAVAPVHLRRTRDTAVLASGSENATGHRRRGRIFRIDASFEDWPQAVWNVKFAVLAL